MAQTQNEGFIQPKIVRGQVDSLSLFEITDYELELLAQGGPNSIYINFAIFFFSIALSFFTTLLTVQIDSQKVFTVFVVLTVVGFAVGSVLMVLWFRTRTRISTLVTKIKARVPMAAAANQATTSAQNEKQTESSSTG